MIIEPRKVVLTTRTGVKIQRFIPNAKLKTIGAWCFVDHFGPIGQSEAMVVAAHPHMGLQTVTWIFSGKFEHRDSLGSVQELVPGQINLMTAGKGISHSEISIKAEGDLHAMQLWVALPDESRHMDPVFDHVTDLPVIQTETLKAKVLAGEFMGRRAKTRIFSEMVGVEIRIPAGKKVVLPLEKAFEYGFVVVGGSAKLAAESGELEQIDKNRLVYWAPGEQTLEIEAGFDEDLVGMLLGGVPFPEKILMCWNFIGRTHEEIVSARTQWNARDSRFGSIDDDIGGWIPAPDMPNVTLAPR